MAGTYITKLYYKKMDYPSDLATNEYMQFLAEGGYAVGKLAMLLLPGGIEVGMEHSSDFAQRPPFPLEYARLPRHGLRRVQQRSRRPHRLGEKLLRYCKLDTMSMVIVWKHWTHNNLIT